MFKSKQYIHFRTLLLENQGFISVLHSQDRHGRSSQIDTVKYEKVENTFRTSEHCMLDNPFLYSSGKLCTSLE